ncbi:MAG: GTP cyclohydrolase II [Pseudomonadales bacterium]|nr:GTP cyclohydrolase II [Pseudomonadales bacterium]
MSVRHIASSRLPTEWGEFNIHVFEDPDSGKEHVALTHGAPRGDEPILCRVHSECLTGDALYSLRCDCGAQLQEAMRRISAAGRGVILYLRQEGRDIGLGNKIRAYALQDQGADTVQANVALGFGVDERDYGICAPLLEMLGIKRIVLMTNNPEKVQALEALGIEVVERQALNVGENRHNQHYLSTKRNKLGHLF